MAKRTLKRAAGLVQAPKDAATADIWLARVGGLVRQREAIQSDLNERVEEARAFAAAKATPIDAEIQQLSAGLQLWAEANREALTRGGQTKTIELAAGKLLWRTRPPSVRLKDVGAVLEQLRSMELTRFIRTKEEVNKEAMLEAPVLAATVPGVTIGSAGEEFVVEPITEVLPMAAGVAA